MHTIRNDSMKSALLSVIVQNVGGGGSNYTITVKKGKQVRAGRGARGKHTMAWHELARHRHIHTSVRRLARICRRCSADHRRPRRYAFHPMRDATMYTVNRCSVSARLPPFAFLPIRLLKSSRAYTPSRQGSTFAIHQRGHRIRQQRDILQRRPKIPTIPYPPTHE